MNIFLTYYYNSHEKKELPTTARVLQTNLVRHEFLNRAEHESTTQSVVKTSFIFCETELSELDLWGVNLAFFWGTKRSQATTGFRVRIVKKMLKQKTTKQLNF